MHEEEYIYQPLQLACTRCGSEHVDIARLGDGRAKWTDCRDCGKHDVWLMHAHPAYFGSELACELCNPWCHEYHGFGKPEQGRDWCGHEQCPMHPKNYDLARDER